MTVGILFPGEMGAALGLRLAESGLHVLTTLEGRSDRTAALCAGLKDKGRVDYQDGKWQAK